MRNVLSGMPVGGARKAQREDIIFWAIVVAAVSIAVMATIIYSLLADKPAVKKECTGLIEVQMSQRYFDCKKRREKMEKKNVEPGEEKSIKLKMSELIEVHNDIVDPVQEANAVGKKFIGSGHW